MPIFNLGGDYHGLGQVYLRQDKPIKAADAFQKALKFHKIVNANILQGNDYRSLGELYLKLNKQVDATVACEKALELYKLMNNNLGQGNIYHLFGRIHISQGNTNDAESSFIKASEFLQWQKVPITKGLYLVDWGTYICQGDSFMMPRKYLRKQ